LHLFGSDLYDTYIIQTHIDKHLFDAYINLGGAI